MTLSENGRLRRRIYRPIDRCSHTTKKAKRWKLLFHCIRNLSPKGVCGSVAWPGRKVLRATRWSTQSNYSCSRCVSQDEVNLAVVMPPPVTHHLAVPRQHSKTRTWQWIGSLFTDYHLHFEIFCMATGDYLFTALELVKKNFACQY